MPKRKADSMQPEVRHKKSAHSSAKDAPSATQQKGLLAEFMGVTHADKTTAGKLLKQHGWNVGAAINAFFNTPQAGNTTNKATLNKLFDKYRDDPKAAPDELNVEGTSNLLSEIDIELSDVGALVLLELVQSPTLGVITRDGFVEGLSSVQADSEAKLRTIVLQRRSQLATDKTVLKGVYNHTFALALQEKQKSLPMEMATEFWKVLLVAPSFEWRTPSTPWLDWWLEFYEAKIKKAVNKDLWKQTLNFAFEAVRDDSLAFWSEESSWPSVIDEFVEWVKEKRATGDTMDTN